MDRQQKNGLNVIPFVFFNNTIIVARDSMVPRYLMQVNDINLVPKMGHIIKVQWPVSSAPISGLYHRSLLAACK
jgi:hypothetical protein